MTKHGLHATHSRARCYIKPGQTVAPLPKRGAQNDRPQGVQAGVVYRLANGQLVYVQRARRQTPSDGK